MEKYDLDENDLFLDEVKRIIYQIALGVQFLHINKIAHRDLKEANIILKNGIWKICDFGLSKNAENLKTKLGTCAYMAPELLNYPNNKKYNTKVDIWALGIIFYNLLFGHFYFNSYSQAILNEEIQTKEFKLKKAQKKKITYRVYRLLKKMLKKNPNKRIDIEGVLKHSAFESISKDFTNIKPEPNPILIENYGYYVENDEIEIDFCSTTILEQEEERQEISERFITISTLDQDLNYTIDWGLFFEHLDNLSDIYNHFKHHGKNI